jgi:hypothetical protein
MTQKQAIFIVVLFGIGIFIMGGIFGWVIKPCPACIGTVTVSVTDSSAPAKDTGVIAINSHPKLKETRRFNGKQNYSYTSDTNKINCLADDTVNNHVFSYTSSCLDTNVFTIDSSQKDNFKIKATATVTNNQLKGLVFEYQDFKPEKWKVSNTTTTNVVEKEVEKKSALIKVFPELYARTNFNAITVTGGGAGGGASFVVKDRHLVGIDAGANKSLGQPISGEVMLRYGFKIHLGK